MSTVRIHLPVHLRRLARTDAEVTVDVADPVTQRTVLDALESAHPALRNTVRDGVTGRRRPFVRFFVDGEDRSHDDVDLPLPAGVGTGEVPFMVIGAMAGG